MRVRAETGGYLAKNWVMGGGGGGWGPWQKEMVFLSSSMREPTVIRICSLCFSAGLRFRVSVLDLGTSIEDTDTYHDVVEQG